MLDGDLIVVNCLDVYGGTYSTVIMLRVDPSADHRPQPQLLDPPVRKSCSRHATPPTATLTRPLASVNCAASGAPAGACRRPPRR
jgi:hypothetical protein